MIVSRTQIYKIIIAEENPDLSEAIVETCNQHIKLEVIETIDNLHLLKDHMRRSQFDVLIIGHSLKDATSIEAIEMVLKINPLPILYLPLIREENVEYPTILNLGFIDTVEIQTEITSISNYNLIKIPNIVALKAVILSKLNMVRFEYQVKLFLEGKLEERLISRDKNTKGITLEKQIIKKIAKKILSRADRVTSKDVIVIGASIGGPRALMYLIPQFPKNFPPVLLVQHMSQGFVNSFANRMNDRSQMGVKMARTGDPVQRGHVYIAPGGHHMEVITNSNNIPVIEITSGPSVNFSKPAVDVTLFAAARIWGSGVISVILTGMGNDGRSGTRIVKKLGGRAIALNEADSVVYGMNKSIVDTGLADSVVGIDEITTKLGEFLGYNFEIDDIEL